MYFKEIVEKHEVEGAIKALLSCEHCGKEIIAKGRDNDVFYVSIRTMVCSSCGKGSVYAEYLKAPIDKDINIMRQFLKKVEKKFDKLVKTQKTRRTKNGKKEKKEKSNEKFF